MAHSPYSASSSACLAPDFRSSGTFTSVSRYWRNFSAVLWLTGSTPAGNGGGAFFHLAFYSGVQ